MHAGGRPAYRGSLKRTVLLYTSRPPRWGLMQAFGQCPFGLAGPFAPARSLASSCSAGRSGSLTSARLIDPGPPGLMAVQGLCLFGPAATAGRPPRYWEGWGRGVQCHRTRRAPCTRPSCEVGEGSLPQDARTPLALRLVRPCYQSSHRTPLPPPQARAPPCRLGPRPIRQGPRPRG